MGSPWSNSLIRSVGESIYSLIMPTEHTQADMKSNKQKINNPNELLINEIERYEIQWSSQNAFGQGI